MVDSAPSRSSCPGPQPAEMRGRGCWRCENTSWGGCPRGKVGPSPTQPLSQLRPQFPLSLCTPTVPCPPPRTRPIPLTLSRAFTLSPPHTETRSAAPRGSQNAVPAGDGGEATDRAPTPALPGARTPSPPALAAAGSPVFSQTCWSNLGTIGLLGRSWRSPGAALRWEPRPGALCTDPGLEPKSADGPWTARQPVSPLPKPGRQSRGTHAMLAAWRARCPHPTRGERQKAGFGRPATQTAASVGCFSLPIGKADSTLTAESHRDQQVQAEHSRSAVSIGCAKAFHASRSSDV